MALGRLRRLLAGADVRLVHPQDVHELDAVDPVDDSEQLALVQRAAEGPAVRRPPGRAADQRIQIDVERVQDVLLDALQIGQRRRPHVSDDAHASQSDRQQPNAGAKQAALVELRGDHSQQLRLRNQLVQLQEPVRWVDARQNVDADRPGALGRGAHGAGDLR